jgi:hypothetical protein
MQLFAIVAPMLRVWEEAYMHHHTGHLDEETWEMMVAQFRDLMSMDAFQKLWRLRKHVYIKRFAAFVDSVEPNVESYNQLYQTINVSNPPSNKAMNSDA